MISWLLDIIFEFVVKKRIKGIRITVYISMNVSTPLCRLWQIVLSFPSNLVCSVEKEAPNYSGTTPKGYP